MTCEDCCEAKALTTWDEGLDFALWTGRMRYTPLCVDCWLKRDRAELARQREVIRDASSAQA